MVSLAVMEQQETILNFQKPFDLGNGSSKNSPVVPSLSQKAEYGVNCKFCNKEIIISNNKRHRSFCNNKCSSEYYYYSNRESRLRKKREYDIQNRESVREQYREWYKRNKEKKIFQKKVYYLINKDRYKKYNKRVREKFRKELVGYDLFRLERTVYYSIKKNPYLLWRKNYCELCGWDIDSRILDAHHIDSIIKNTERDNPNNILTLCKNCHSLLHTLTIQEVYKLNKQLKNGQITITKLKCRKCNKEFIPINSRQKHCSKECYTKSVHSYKKRLNLKSTKNMIY